MSALQNVLDRIDHGVGDIVGVAELALDHDEDGLHRWDPPRSGGLPRIAPNLLGGQLPRGRWVLP